MEEKKQKKALEHKVNMLYDKQRIEMAETVNYNHFEFSQRNLAVAIKQMEDNQELDRQREENELNKKLAE